MANIVICLSHSIEEFQQLTFLHELGHNVFSIGGYINPAHPHDIKRPAAPQVPHYPELQKAVDFAGGLGPAQEHIPAAVLDWADIVIFHHYLDRLWNQWDAKIKPWLKADSSRRVIWRTVGQSNKHIELAAHPYRNQGLEILRYSPREAHLPNFAGQDALIRFWVDPAEWTGWVGDKRHVLNVTQHFKQRDPHTNWRAWEQFTKGLPRHTFGPGSEAIGGPGQLPFEDMKAELRAARCYLYTGTQPASYTLGMIEAMMTGVPMVCIGRHWHDIHTYGPDLFEGPDLCVLAERHGNPRALLELLLNDDAHAQAISQQTRQVAIDNFAKDKIAREWKEFLA